MRAVHADGAAGAAGRDRRAPAARLDGGDPRLLQANPAHRAKPEISVDALEDGRLAVLKLERGGAGDANREDAGALVVRREAQLLRARQGGELVADDGGPAPSGSRPAQSRFVAAILARTRSRAFATGCGRRDRRSTACVFLVTVGSCRHGGRYLNPHFAPPTLSGESRQPAAATSTTAAVQCGSGTGSPCSRKLSM